MQENISKWTKTDVVVLPDVVPVKVVGIGIKSSAEAFGTKAKSDGDVIQIAYEGIEHNIKGDFFMTYFAPTEVPEGSKLGKFLTKYNNLEVGTMFKVVKNGDFFEPLI